MVDILMGGNTQMYYLNGRIDYNEIVTSPACRPPPPLSGPWGENHSVDGVCVFLMVSLCCVTGDYDLIYNGVL